MFVERLTHQSLQLVQLVEVKLELDQQRYARYFDVEKRVAVARFERPSHTILHAYYGRHVWVIGHQLFDGVGVALDTGGKGEVGGDGEGHLQL